MRYFELLEGAVDLHMHPGPTKIPTRIDFLEAAKEAEAVGMKAIVFKPLYFPTMDRAYAAEKSVSKLRIFGGIVLDFGMGGLNPFVVKNAIDMGAKFVWMPLFDSKNTKEKLSASPVYKNLITGEKSIEILTETGQLLPEVKEILNIISKPKDVVLETSHISPLESLVLIEEAKRLGITNVLVTHPLTSVIGATQEEIRKMVEKGAIINHCVAQCYPHPGRGSLNPLNPTKIAESIKDVGAENCVLSTDLGGIFGPTPVDGLRAFCEMMMVAGITKQEIEVMIKDNPTKILGLT